jgi:hypothetical protein
VCPSNYDKSFVICDEADSVVDPLKCEMNIPIGEKLRSPPELGLLLKRVLDGRSLRFLSFFESRFALNVVSEEKPELEKKFVSVDKIASSMILQTQYGLGKNLPKSAEEVPTSGENVMTAIPFSSANTPSEGSRFTDLELRFVLTKRSLGQMIENSGTFRDVDVIQLAAILEKDIPSSGNHLLEDADKLKIALPGWNEG